MRSVARIAVLILGLFIFCNQTPGQTQPPQTFLVKAKLDSKAKDAKKDEPTKSENGEIPGAKVTATRTGTNVSKDCHPKETDLKGECTFQLEPGTYDFIAEKRGFEKAFAEAVPVHSGVSSLTMPMNPGDDKKTTKIDVREGIELALAKSETITVTEVSADTPRIETLASGTFLAQDISLRKGRVGNWFMIAGAANKEPFFVADSVGGITKSGTNAFHGLAYYVLQHEAIAAKHRFLLPGDDRVRLHQFGGSLGGPLRKDKLFFFTGYEGNRRLSAPKYSPVLVESLPILNNRLAQLGLPQELLESALPTEDSNSFIGKLDFQATNNVGVGARYELIQDNFEFYGVGGIVGPSNSRARRFHRQDLVIPTVVSGASWISETRVQFAFGRSRNSPFNSTAPNILIPQVLSYGRPHDLVDRDQFRLFGIQETLKMTLGNHDWSVGVIFEHAANEYRQPLFETGRAIVPALQDFLLGPPRAVLFALGFGGAEIDLRSDFVSLYFQDSWRISRNLTLTPRLRYELDRPPELARRDNNNLAPAFGLSWDAGRISLNAGYEIAYSRQPLTAYGQALLLGGVGLQPGIPPAVRQAQSFFGPTATSAFSQFLTTGSTPTGPQLAVPVDLHFQNPYAQISRVGVEGALPRVPSVILQLNYVFNRGAALPLRVNTNLLPPTLQANGLLDFGYAFRNLQFAQTDEAQAAGNSFFHGMEVRVLRRHAGRFGVDGRYYFSRKTDEGGELGALQNPQDRRDDRSLSSDHKAHFFRLSFTADLPWELKLFAIGSASSGRFLNVILGDDLNRDGEALTDRPIGIGRNTFKGPGQRVLDLSTQRRFTLTEEISLIGSLELENVFNVTNFTRVNTVVGSANLILSDPRIASGSRFFKTDFRTPLLPGTHFGRGTEAAQPRRLQVKLRLEF